MPTLCGTVSLGSWPAHSIGEDTALEVTFGVVLDEIPRVIVQIAGIDAAADRGTRLETWSSDATREGFRLHACTWGDSITYGVKVSWVATTDFSAVQLGTLSLGGASQTPVEEAQKLPVTFEAPLPCAPEIILGLSAFEGRKDQHLRFRSETLKGCSRGFTLQASSWASSVILSARVSYVATVSPAVLQCGVVKFGEWPCNPIQGGEDRHLQIQFPRAFDRSPSVALGLMGLDASCDAPTRIEAWADSISPTGFRLFVRSWEDSVTWQAGVSWVATAVVSDATVLNVPPHLPPRQYDAVGPPLGQGWWAVTHRARHAASGRTYAVKTCRHPFQKHEEALRRELLTLRKLPVHCNIMRYYECIVQSDRLHIVTEFLHAFKVAELVPNPDGTWPMPHSATTVLRWAQQICDGLAQLHRACIVHRDLHGDNIMVVKDNEGAPSAGWGAIRIIDFGAAGFYNDASSPRLMSQEAGCWQYFSPERRAGNAFDGRDDVWAVGCHVTELFTGRRIRCRPNCGVDGGDFALNPAAVQCAIEDCKDGGGHCRQVAASLLDIKLDRRPQAAAACDAILTSLGCLSGSCFPGLRSGPSGGSRVCRSSRKKRRLQTSMEDRGVHVDA